MTRLCLLLLAAALNTADAADTHVYKSVAGRDLKLTVVKPPDWEAADKRPAPVFVHGGGWTGGTLTQFEQKCEYRLIAKGDKGPPIDCVHDAKSAMRWVRAHAGELGIDPNRIGAGGGSAGGHLAAFVGMVEGLDDPKDDLSVSPKANALLLFNPVFDNGPDLGWGHSRVGDRYQEFSPAHNISAGDPPAIVFLGTADKLIPVAVVERFKAGMEKAGVRCDAHFYEGQAHGFFNPGKGGKEEFYLKTLLEADRFLVSLGWLQGEATLKMPKAE